MVLGGGLVWLVIRLVKSVRLPTTLVAKFCTPVTTEPAKAEPGSVGIEGWLDWDGAVVGVALPVVVVPRP